jgi:GxxExxY protein
MNAEHEPIPEDVNRIATQIVDAALRAHSALGPGLLESVYEACLAHELRKRGLTVECQHPIPVRYDGIQFDESFRIDLLVQGCVIVELKTTSDDHPIHKAQLMTYLKRTRLRLGFLVNFNKKCIKDGIERIAL